MFFLNSMSILLEINQKTETIYPESCILYAFSYLPTTENRSPINIEHSAWSIGHRVFYSESCILYLVSSI